ncbi:hypothetical protein ACOME3_007199 [Neoechinorhynchus agilis]
MLNWAKRGSNAQTNPPPHPSPPSYGWRNDSLESDHGVFQVEPSTQITIKTKTILPKQGQTHVPSACKFISKPSKHGVSTVAVYTVRGLFDPNTGYVHDESDSGYSDFDNRRRSSGGITQHLEGYLSSLPKPTKNNSTYEYSQPMVHGQKPPGIQQPFQQNNNADQSRFHQPQGNDQPYIRKGYERNEGNTQQNYGERANQQQLGHNDGPTIEHLRGEFQRLAASEGHGPQSMNFASFLRLLTRALGAQPDQDTAGSIFRLLDTKSDGVIDFEEFRDAYCRLVAINAPKQRRFSWHKINEKTRL